NLEYFLNTPFNDLEFYVRLVRVAESSTDWTHAASEARRTALWPKGVPALLSNANQEAREEPLAELLRQEIMALRDSRSWRFTRPFRVISSTLKTVSAHALRSVRL